MQILQLYSGMRFLDILGLHKNYLKNNWLYLCQGELMNMAS